MKSEDRGSILLRALGVSQTKKFVRQRKRTFKTIEEHLTKYQVNECNCWVWTGPISVRGYGIQKVGGREGKQYYAHRLSYEHHVGPIPEGLELDHLCRNRACINPKHLEPVTRSVNTKRGIGPAMLGAINASKTHCKHGHPFSGDNVKYRKSGGRRCVTCERNRKRK